MSTGWPRGLALVALGALIVMLLRQSGIDMLQWLLAVPPGLAALAALASLRWWAPATALLMLPYFAYGVMDMLTDPAGRNAAAGFTMLTIVVFFAALDSRRRG